MIGYLLVFLGISVPSGAAFYFADRLGKEERSHADTKRMLDGWIDKHEQARRLQNFSRDDL